MTTDSLNDPFWQQARSAMLLDPNVCNLNTGSFGPLPRCVFERVTEFRKQLAAEPTDFIVRRLPPLLWQAREALARYIGGRPERLVFTANVSVAINIVASSLQLAAPGEILLTDHEYGAMHWCWERAAIRQGLTLRTFPLPVMANSPEEIVRAFAAAMTERTRLLFFSHVLSPTGLVLPAKEICAEARRRGIMTVVDGAHAPAMIPLNVEEIHADFYCANGHKWLLAPIGTGFLYFLPEAIERIEPMQVSWGWHYERKNVDAADEYGSTPRTRALEFEGTRDFCPWLAVPEAIEFQAKLGWDKIRNRIEELVQYTRQRLTGLCGLELATPALPLLHGSMTAFRIADKVKREWSELRQEFWQRGIEIPIVIRPDYLLLRVSTHFYNTHEEIDRLAAAVEEIIG
ncbi:MAG TPA: aminotransferase class V-fold PLP-dependent enzyme [Gemmataceae bacterium]|nr:aminotransferase class V-fold PLP-dependent enzyme [Gemmataceae bacterium]